MIVIMRSNSTQMHSFEEILWCLVAPQLAMNRPTNHLPFPQSLVARPSRRDKSRVRSGPRVESLWVVRAARKTRPTGPEGAKDNCRGYQMLPEMSDTREIGWRSTWHQITIGHPI